MSRWNYKVLVHKVLVGRGEGDLTEDRQREEILDEYGQDGWELVSVVQQSYRRESDPTTLYGYTFFSYYFKRPVDSMLVPEGMGAIDKG